MYLSLLASASDFTQEGIQENPKALRGTFQKIGTSLAPYADQNNGYGQVTFIDTNFLHRISPF
jgi:hypothetical protein